MYQYPFNNPILAPTPDKLCNATQNTSQSSLDLLVREALQNSLDAALTAKEPEFVSIVFIKSTFHKEDFASLLGDESSKEQLRAKLDGDKHCCLAIRDKNTTGLTGTVDDCNSNLFKMVYGFYNGKSSDESISGGSFGAGKTVFLRPGKGFVIYYSRTTEGISKLFMFYCQNGGDAIFDKETMPWGIAWWGDERKGKNGEMLPPAPVTDEARIEEILGVFNIEPYKNTETGTTVIIPFIDEDALKGEEETEDRESNPQQNKFRSLKDCLEFSVMKWYAPRYRGDLMAYADGNYTHFPWGKQLTCGFIFDGIKQPLDTEGSWHFAFFKEMRNMYDMAVKALSEDYPADVPYEKDYRVLRCKCKFNRSQDETSVGALVYRRFDFSENELASNPSSRTLYETFHYLADTPERSRQLIYCRGQGMIVTYNDNDWSKVLSDIPLNDGECLFGIFVVDTQSKLKDGTKVESLFRQIEKVDHSNWPIDSKVNSDKLIKGVKLIKKVTDELRKQVKSKEGIADLKGDDTQRSVEISKFLAQCFSYAENSSNESARRKAGASGQVSFSLSFETRRFYKDNENGYEVTHLFKVKCMSKSPKVSKFAFDVILDGDGGKGESLSNLMKEKSFYDAPIELIEAWSPCQKVKFGKITSACSGSVSVRLGQFEKDETFCGRITCRVKRRDLAYNLNWGRI
ncbi:MAG: hypothetical protein IJS08_04465 [Victivallales bacterium]|nr:hypothetical protein [Victivallales bacterium]